MTYRTLTTRRDGAVLYVDIANPPLNLITIEMVGDLFDLAGDLAFDPETKVVVLGSATPEFFVAHFDLNDLFRSLTDPTVPQSRYEDINVLQALTTMWQTLPQVTIGKVDGIVRGGGLELLLALNMRFVTPGSRLCFPEAAGGFLPTGGGTTRLAMQLSPARALEILLSSRDFTGDEAVAYGIANRTLPPEQLDAYVTALATSIGSRSAQSIAAVKGVLNAVYNDAADAQFAGFAVENTAMTELVHAPEVRAHLERMAAQQDVEHERDLPASIDAGWAVQI